MLRGKFPDGVKRVKILGVLGCFGSILSPEERLPVQSSEGQFP